ncbi:MAG: TRAP transporter small permease subunit [Clostridiales bacterium]|nr:TRAP transporter small permease subunit [Clostridiales bacterium]
MKKGFHYILKVLCVAEDVIVSICSAAMVFLVALTVVLRYIFKTQIVGIEDLIMLVAFAVYFIGAALGSREETEITADLMSLFIKKPKNLALLRAYQRGLNAVLMGICAYFTANQIQIVVDAQSKTTGMHLPMWAYYSLILVGLILVSFYSLYHFITYIIQIVNMKKDSKEGNAQ